MNIEDALRSARDGDALLFVGAGLSHLAKRTNGAPVPDGRKLANILLEQPETAVPIHPLDRIAGNVLRSKGVDFVYDLLKQHFEVASVDEKLKTLYSFPWKRIYTTNYDNAAEVARNGLFPISSVTIDEAHSAGKLGSIIHLNGFIKRISPANLQTHLLLTDTSYAAARLLKTGWLTVFERDLNTSRAIVFAGYSLSDLEIDKVLLTASDLKKKTFFFVSPTADEIEVSTLERYGTVVTGGIDALISKLEETRANYHPPTFIRGFTTLHELHISTDLADPSSSVQKLTNQLVYGRLPEKEILAKHRVFENQTYLVDRKQDLEARLAIQQGPWRDILFTGEIASGKSASTLTFASHLAEQGYKVFFAVKSEQLESDLRRLSANPDKVAVIFDGYSSFRKEITAYADCRPQTHRIVLSERSALHELIGDFISNTPHLGPVREIALNRIDKDDAAAFESLANFGGFWGERAGLSIASRQNYIEQRLDGSLYRFLIEIIKSEKIQSQLRELVKPINDEPAIAKAFCSALIVNSLGFNFSISEWQYLFERDLIRRMLFSYSNQVQHFMLSRNDQIYIRYGLLSAHVLHAFMDNGLISDCLIGLYEICEERAIKGNNWRSLSIELTKFSSIEPMFSGPTAAANIFGYYDSIRVYGDTRNNPDYWLQLGIAGTVLDDLPRAKLSFQNAYSRERARSKPNLTRIDNYFSRFEMREAVAESNPDIAFKSFIAANERLDKQIFLDINRHYPFKTGRYFTDIAAKHFQKWNDRQRAQFKEAVQNIKLKAEEWKARNREHNPDVEILIRETTTLLKQL